MAKDVKDYPLNEIVATAKKLIADGATVFQKFTCDKCGQRLTIHEANTFYKTADCERCGHTTDIQKKGCNYLLIQSFPAGR